MSDSCSAEHNQVQDEVKRLFFVLFFPWFCGAVQFVIVKSCNCPIKMGSVVKRRMELTDLSDNLFSGERYVFI